MDRSEFIASLVRSLAWPTVVLVVVVMFRAAIRSTMAGQVRRWRVGPVEAEYWEANVAVVREQLPPDAERKAEVVSGGLVDELTGIAEVAPAAAVLEAFVRIEQELRRIAVSYKVPDADRATAQRLALHMNMMGWVTDETVTAIEGLTVMRNLAAHGRHGTDLDTRRAVEYLHIAAAVLYALEAARPAAVSTDTAPARPRTAPPAPSAGQAPAPPAPA